MMFGTRVLRGMVVLLFGAVLTAVPALAQAAGSSNAKLRLYDTVSGSLRPLTPVAMSSPSRWKVVPAGENVHEFSGDAIVMGSEIAAVLRRNGRGVEIHTRTVSGWQHAATMAPKGEEHESKSLRSLTIVQNTPQEVVLEGAYKTLGAEDLVVRIRVLGDSDCVEMAPVAGAQRACIEAPTRFAVLPGSAGDGLLVDAAAVSGVSAEVTGENYVLHLLDHGDVMVLSHWTGEENTVTAVVAGAGDDRQIVSTEVPLAEGSSVSTSVLSLRGSWMQQQGSEGEGTRVVWRWPVPAPWVEESAQQPEIDGGKLAKFEAGTDRVSGGGAVPFTILYDTRRRSESTLAPEVMSGYKKWQEIPVEETAYVFEGDVVVLNDQLAMVLRKLGNGAEIYARNGRNMRHYAVVTPVGTSVAQALQSVDIEHNTEDSVILNATFKTGDGGAAGIRFEMDMGQVYVKTQPLAGTTKVLVRAPCRFAVLPDFFADDIVIDARDITGDFAELPSENFLLHMLDDGNAIVATVWDNRDQDTRVTLSGTVANRTIDSSEIAYGNEGSTWVAVLSDPGIWHKREIALADKDKVIPLPWTVPFTALWRVDWERVDGLTDSWEMLSQNADGSFKKHGLFQESEDSWTIQDWWGSGERTRITSGLGRFKYPCWVDMHGRGNLQPLKEGVDFQGPAIIYPINRLAATPLDKYTLVDVVRATLGVGPCQYILDVEGQQEMAAGWPTCTVRDVLDEIYEKNQQGRERAEVEQALKNVVDFITLIRSRIETYEEFGRDLQEYLTEAKARNPAHTEFLDEMLDITKQIDEHVAERREAIKSVEFAQQLVDEFRADVLNDTSPEAVTKCKEITGQWVEIGGNQDELVAECRMIVRVLRQRAGMALAGNPSLEEIVGEIRERTQAVLRAPVNYEAAHH